MSAPFRKSTREVLEVIQGVLAPYLGALMARTAAGAHCRDLGIAGADMDRGQVEALLERLRLGLIIFLGKEKTAAVVAAMERAVDALGEAR